MGNFTSPRTEFYRDYEAAGIRYYMRDDGTAKPTAAAGPESLQRLKIPVATTTLIFTY
jgi:hypothetical protein